VSENETRTLEVLQEDIDSAAGRTSSALGCPFAYAARRLFPGWQHVSVAYAAGGTLTSTCTTGQKAHLSSGSWTAMERRRSAAMTGAWA